LEKKDFLRAIFIYMKWRVLYKMTSFHALLFKKGKKKPAQNNVTVHHLLPLDALKAREEGFFPLLCNASLSLSLSPTCPKTPTQPTLPRGLPP
jgi:hypothetical protein